MANETNFNVNPADQQALDAVRAKDDAAQAREREASARGAESWRALDKRDLDNQTRVRQIREGWKDREREEQRQRDADETLQKYSDEKGKERARDSEDEQEQQQDEQTEQDRPREALELSVPMETPRDHFERVESYVQEISPLAKELGVPQDEMQGIVDYAVALGVSDSSGVNIEDRQACETVLENRYGQAEAAKIISDAQAAVTRLGPKAANFLIETQLGNSPAVLMALAEYQRGSFRMSPEKAQAELDKLTKGEDLRSAYRNASHSGHKAAVDRANMLYGVVARGEAKKAARESSANSKPAQAPVKSNVRSAQEAELKALVAHPGYHDHGNSESRMVRARIAALYESLYPGYSQES